MALSSLHVEYPPRPAGGIFNLAAFGLLVGSFGALALVAQVVFLRQLLVAFYGSEIIIALVLAGWLAGVFLGAQVAGALNLSGRRLKFCLWLAPWLWLACLGGLLAMSYLIPGLTGLAPGEAAPFELALGWTAALTAPGSLFVGGLFVLAGSYWRERFEGREAERSGLGGSIFWVESAGSCLGLLLYTFFMAGRVGSIQALAFMAGLVLLALAVALPGRATARAVSAALVLAAGLTLHFSGLAAELDAHADRVRFARAHPNYELLAARDTPYQHLALARRGGEMSLFGDQSFIASWPDPSEYQVLTLLFLTQARRFDRVLLAGPGPGAFIHEMLKFGVRELVYVALDPDETGLVARHLTPDQARDLDDPRLRIVHDDLRRYLARAEGPSFDLIAIMAPDPDNARINRLYTQDFFKQAASRLRPQGVLVTSIAGADNYWGREMRSYGLSLYRTLKTVFPVVVVTPGDRHFFFAGPESGPVSGDPDKLGSRYERLGFTSPYFKPRSFYQFFQPTAVEYLKARLESDRETVLNTDAVPLSYYLRLVWWEKMTGRPWTRALLRQALEVRRWGPLALGLLCLPLVIIVIRPAPARISAWTMTLTGGTVMALQVILIFLFQNRHGVVYERIGLLSALFMAGLALGGLIGRQSVAAGVRTRKVLPVLELLLAGLAGLAALNAWDLIPDVILPLVGLAGLLAGLEFALLFALYLKDRSRPSVTRALAGLEAADHAGALVGALVTGVVLAPVLGLGLTALALAFLKLFNAAAVIRVNQ